MSVKMFSKFNRYNAEFAFPEGSVSIHDPSIFYDNATHKYYVFGSHFAIASSDDLIHWTQLSVDGESGARLLYGRKDFRSVLKEADKVIPYTAQGKITTTWAPHVEKIGKTYYMYYSLTSAFGSSRSAIGRVRSNSVLGPYSNDEMIVWSTGRSSPNCIDPQILRDRENKLWLVYGSFFEGIFIKELDETGLPVQSGVHDYGKLLWKGGKTGAEGPFIFYNEKTEYYYLTASDGSLSSNYNMRVARSRNPEGPYHDITGANTASTYGGGNKLAGNFQFAGEKYGYAALGHNSVLKRNGEYFVICHARFRIGSSNKITDKHRVQVRQLYFNAEGWPVLSPDLYAGERLCRLTSADIKGDYDVIFHSAGNDVKFVSSVPCSLAENGAVLCGGTAAGSFSVADENFLTVTVNGTVYKGVAAPSKNAGVSFTATSAAGESLWGKKKS